MWCARRTRFASDGIRATEYAENTDRCLMFVVYVAFSIAGWVALGLFLSYWAGLISGRRLAHRKKSELVESHEKHS